MAANAPPVDFLDQIVAVVQLEQVPTRQEFVNGLVGLGLFQGLLLLVFGVVYLLSGWKAFKAMVVANAAVLGALIGVALASHLENPNMRIIGAIAGALLLGVIALPLMKHGVAVMGALAGGFMGYVTWRYVAGVSGSQTLGQYAWAGALMGLVTLGLLAFMIFRQTIMIFTSVQGALMLVSGGLTILLKFSALREPLQQNLSGNIHLLPVLVAVPAVIGLAHQNASLAKKNKKKKAAQEGG